MRNQTLLGTLLIVFSITYVLISSHYLYPMQQDPRFEIIERTINEIPLFQNDTKSWHMFSTGLLNIVVCIETKDDSKYILKIYPTRPIDSFPIILERLDLIQQSGIKIPDTIIPPCVIEGLVTWVIEFINGAHITDIDLPNTAQIMAQLHCIETTETSSSPELTVQFFMDHCQSWEYYEFLKQALATLDLDYIQDLPKGLIHGDFSYTNVLVDDHEQLTLIDFDHLRYGYLLTDLVGALRFYAFDLEGNFKKNAFYALMNDYQKVRSLIDIEITHLYTHLKYELIRTAFLMYFFMYTRPNNAEGGVSGNPLLVKRLFGAPENRHLEPELLIKKILSLEEAMHLFNNYFQGF